MAVDLRKTSNSNSSSGTTTDLRSNKSNSSTNTSTNTSSDNGSWIGGKVVQVGADGKAPAGLKVGDKVNTAGGMYKITGVNADGTYQSSLMGTYGGNTTPASNSTPNTLNGINASYTSRYGLEDVLAGRTAGLMGLDMGDLYGITYDQQKLLDVYNQATDAQYALKQREMDTAENQYYRNLYNTQTSTIDTLRAQRNNQIASGMSAGLAAAADAATAMGIQDTGATGALELANKRQQMADEIAAAYAQNIVNALENSNTLRAQIAGLDLNKYGADTTWDAAYAATVPAFEEANVNAMAALLGYDSTLDYNNKYYQGMVDVANISAAAQRYTADVTSRNYSNGDYYTTTNDLYADYTKDGKIDVDALKRGLAQRGITDSDQIQAFLDEAELINDGRAAEATNRIVPNVLNATRNSDGTYNIKAAKKELKSTYGLTINDEDISRIVAGVSSGAVTAGASMAPLGPVPIIIGGVTGGITGGVTAATTYTSPLDNLQIYNKTLTALNENDIRTATKQFAKLTNASARSDLLAIAQARVNAGQIPVTTYYTFRNAIGL